MACMPCLQHLLDRIAITLSADVPTSFDERVEAVEIARQFQAGSTARLQIHLFRTNHPVSVLLFSMHAVHCSDRAAL